MMSIIADRAQQDSLWHLSRLFLNVRVFRNNAPLSEVDCSASTSLDSSIVFISHLQSVSCFTLAIYSYNCYCCSLKGLSSSFLPAS